MGLRVGMAEKVLYKGVFSYSHELVVKFAHAYTGRQAKVFMMRQLAKEHGVRYNIVAQIFNGQKPNFLISRELPNGM